jgi:hypothetical protein
VECTGRGAQIENGKVDALHGAWASGVNVTHIDDGVNEPAPEAWQKERIHSDLTGGANILLCDASVQFFSEDTNKKIIRWMASRDGGEQISEEMAE